MGIDELVSELRLILKKAAKVVDEIDLKNKEPENNEPITPEEYTALMWELDGWPEIAEAMLKKYNIVSAQQLPRKELITVRTRIKEIKSTHESYGVK